VNVICRTLGSLDKRAEPHKVRNAQDKNKVRDIALTHSHRLRSASNLGSGSLIGSCGDSWRTEWRWRVYTILSVFCFLF